MSSHDKANKQAELDVSASMGEMLQDMQACLKQLCGSSAIQDPEAVAKLIAEKVTAMNMSSDSVPKDSGERLALPVVAAKHKVVLPDMLADAKRHKASLIQAPTLYDSSGSINTVALAWKEWCTHDHCSEGAGEQGSQAHVTWGAKQQPPQEEQASTSAH